ncbi:MAG: hypothetical protein Q4E07_03160 [Eubacteriales bacterium]|nr:hypothetical protein [Eubacteriales bacterium]
MKKLLALLMSALLFLTGVFAEEEWLKPLTVAELNGFTESLVARAMEDNLPVEKENDNFVVHGRGYTLYPVSEDLSRDTLLLGAVIDAESIEVAGLTGPRVTIATQAAGAVLSSFPNDNPTLSGTPEEAVLYLRGTLPEDVHVGKITRSGQAITLIEYSVYTQGADGVNQIGLQYTVSSGFVSAIRYFVAHTISLAEAKLRLQGLSKLQEENSYFAYNAVEPTMLVREDLSIANIDFLDISPEIAEKNLGKPVSSNKVYDNTGNIIETMEWEDLSVTFVYDKDGKFMHAKNMVAFGNVEGPRAIRSGENMLMVLDRFPIEAASLNQEKTLIYGKEETGSPYALLTQNASEQNLYVNVPLESGDVLFTCRFIGEEVIEISISR